LNCAGEVKDLNYEDDSASVHVDIFGGCDDSFAAVQDAVEEACDNGVGSVEAGSWTLGCEDRCRDDSRGALFQCVQHGQHSEA